MSNNYQNLTSEQLNKIKQKIDMSFTCVATTIALAKLNQNNLNNQTQPQQFNTNSIVTNPNWLMQTDLPQVHTPSRGTLLHQGNSTNVSHFQNLNLNSVQNYPLISNGFNLNSIQEVQTNQIADNSMRDIGTLQNQNTIEDHNNIEVPTDLEPKDLIIFKQVEDIPDEISDQDTINFYSTCSIGTNEYVLLFFSHALQSIGSGQPITEELYESLTMGNQLNDMSGAFTSSELITQVIDAFDILPTSLALQQLKWNQLEQKDTTFDVRFLKKERLRSLRDAEERICFVCQVDLNFCDSNVVFGGCLCPIHFDCFESFYNSQFDQRINEPTVQSRCSCGAQIKEKDYFIARIIWRTKEWAESDN